MTSVKQGRAANSRTPEHLRLKTQPQNHSGVDSEKILTPEHGNIKLRTFFGPQNRKLEFILQLAKSYSTPPM